MTAVEHRVCRSRTAEERKAVAEAAGRRAVRYLIPRRYDAEGDAAMAAITARLREFAESPTVRPVRLTYWRDDADRPVGVVVISSQVIWRWRATVPLTATHMTIEG